MLIRHLLSEREGISLKIGVKDEDGSFESHSWVEESNIVIFGQLKNLEEYKIIHSI